MKMIHESKLSGWWTLALLIVMAWPCLWYYRIKRDRPNLVTRYF